MFQNSSKYILLNFTMKLFGIISNYLEHENHRRCSVTLHHIDLGSMDRDFQNFVGLGPVRDFQIFLGPGPIGFDLWIPAIDQIDQIDQHITLLFSQIILQHQNVFKVS